MSDAIANANKKLLQAYWNQVKSASVLDGDIKVSEDGTELKKVNYGKNLLLRAFGINGRTETIGVGEGTAARVNFFECLKNLGSLGVKSIDDKLLADIKAELKITEKQVKNDSENVEVDNSQPKQPELTAEDTALSRRTIRKVFDMIIAKDANFKKNANLEGDYVKAADAKHFGGKVGLSLSQEQFKGIFEQVKLRGYGKWGEVKSSDKAQAETYAVRKDAFATAADTFLKMFATGRSDGKLEKLFDKGLDIDSIGRSLAKLVDQGKCPIPASTTPSKVGDDVQVVDKGVLENINKMHQAMEEDGVSCVDDKVKIDLPNVKSDVAPRTASHDFASNLIFNESLMDVQTYGITGGERIGRVLMGDMKTFQELCQSVSANGGEEHEVLKSFRQLDESLADAMKGLVNKIVKDCFGGKIPENQADFANKCTSKAQTIFDIVGSAKFKDVDGRSQMIEKVIDASLQKAMTRKDENEKGIVDRLCEALNGEDPEAKGKTNDFALLQKVLHKTLSSATGTDLRRMFAAGFRHPCNNTGFDENALIISSGPYMLKLLQSVAGKDEGMKNVLAIIRGQLPPIDREVIRASLFSQDMGANIKSVTLQGRKGAASIGETFVANLTFNDNSSKNVIVKMLRPGLDAQFKKEVDIFTSVLKDELESLEKDLQSAKKNVESLGEGDERDGEENKIEKTEGKLRSLKAQYDGFINTKISISKELDFRKETLNALRSIATYNFNGDAVKSMGLVLKDDSEDGLKAFNEAIQKAKSESIVNGEVDIAIFDQKLRDDVMKHIVPAQQNVMYCNLEEGLTVDGVIAKALDDKTFPKLADIKKELGFKETDILTADQLNGPKNPNSVAKKLTEKCESLFEARRALLSLAQATIKGLITGQPPYIHGDLHGANLLIKDGNVTLIDHGKGVYLSSNERKHFNVILKNLVSYDDIDGELVSDGKERFQKLAEEIVNSYKAMLEEESKKEDLDPVIKSRIESSLASLEGDLLEKMIDNLNDGLYDCRGDDGFTKLDLFRDFIKDCGFPIPFDLNETLGTLSKLNVAIKRIDETIDKHTSVLHDGCAEYAQQEIEKIPCSEHTVTGAKLFDMTYGSHDFEDAQVKNNDSIVIPAIMVDNKVQNQDCYSKEFFEFYDKVEEKLMGKGLLKFSEVKATFDEVLKNKEHFENLMKNSLLYETRAEQRELNIRGCYRYDQYVQIYNELEKNSNNCSIYGSDNLSLSKKADAHDTTLAEVIELAVNSQNEEVQNQAA